MLPISVSVFVSGAACCLVLFKVARLVLDSAYMYFCTLNYFVYLPWEIPSVMAVNKLVDVLLHCL